MPDSSPTMERREPVRRLKRVDLPTLGRPTIARTGRAGGPAFGGTASRRAGRGFAARDSAGSWICGRSWTERWGFALGGWTVVAGIGRGARCFVGSAGGSGAASFFGARLRFVIRSGSVSAADRFPLCLDFALCLFGAFAVSFNGFHGSPDAVGSGRREPVGTLVHYRERGWRCGSLEAVTSRAGFRAWDAAGS